MIEAMVSCSVCRAEKLKAADGASARAPFNLALQSHSLFAGSWCHGEANHHTLVSHHHTLDESSTDILVEIPIEHLAVGL